MHRFGILAVAGVVLLAACGDGAHPRDVLATSDARDAAVTVPDPGDGGQDADGRPDVPAGPDGVDAPDAKDADDAEAGDDAGRDDPGRADGGDTGDAPDARDAIDEPDLPPPEQVLGLPLRMDGVLYAGAA
ncbi:MAG TPA: hypothetical protein PK313_00605, partial [Myxococcota bacterium]|nr:hypothetical protein [Myxococcota bacterium]